MYPVADLHCDLLSYLANDSKRTASDKEVRCSLPQLKKGNVCFQTLAIYSHTKNKNSVQFAQKQLAIFSTLAKLYPEDFEMAKAPPKELSNKKVHIAAAIENASGLCDEQEPLEGCFRRFDHYREVADNLLYISMTWNDENRFGGGNCSKAGLKREGELLLDYLDNTEIAIDLSHTSDALAYGILEYLDKKKLHITPIASHSNFRAICNQPRNLPDDIVKEIVKRGGVVGLNFFKPFVGKVEDFISHLSHAKTLGAIDHICFGADFFYDREVPSTLYSLPFFYENFEDASCYPQVLACFSQICREDELEKIAHKNFRAFISRREAKEKK